MSFSPVSFSSSSSSSYLSSTFPFLSSNILFHLILSYIKSPISFPPPSRTPPNRKQLDKAGKQMQSSSNNNKNLENSFKWFLSSEKKIWIKKSKKVTPQILFYVISSEKLNQLIYIYKKTVKIIRTEVFNLCVLFLKLTKSWIARFPSYYLYIWNLKFDNNT